MSSSVLALAIAAVSHPGDPFLLNANPKLEMAISPFSMLITADMQKHWGGGRKSWPYQRLSGSGLAQNTEWPCRSMCLFLLIKKAIVVHRNAVIKGVLEVHAKIELTVDALKGYVWWYLNFLLFETNSHKTKTVATHTTTFYRYIDIDRDI